jgi:putative hydroxymethylpyrimidine transport system substrate-binding protein
MLFAACGSDASGSSGSDGKLDVMLDWTPNAGNSALYWAKDKGLFKDEGVSVNVVTPGDASVPLKMVATGKVDLAYSYEADTMVAVGQGLPVVAVGAIYPGTISGLLAPAGGSVTSIDDLKGKKIGYSGIPTYKAYLDQMLSTAGLSPDDVDLINVGYNDVPTLLAGKVDALGDSFLTAQAKQVQLETGEEPFFVKNTDLGVPAHNELVFVANASKLKDADYVASVGKFLKAYYKAAAEIEGKPDEVTELMSKYSSDDEDYLRLSVEANLAEWEPFATDPTTACLDADEWSSFADWMVSAKLLKSAPDLTTVMTNEHLDAKC